MITSADRVAVYYIAKEDATVTNLACVRYIHYNLDGWLCKLLAADNRYLYTLDNIS